MKSPEANNLEKPERPNKKEEEKKKEPIPVRPMDPEKAPAGGSPTSVAEQAEIEEAEQDEAETIYER